MLHIIWTDHLKVRKEWRREKIGSISACRFLACSGAAKFFSVLEGAVKLKRLKKTYTDLDLRREMTIFDSFLTIFEASVIIWDSWDSSENWLVPKTLPTLRILTKLSLSKSVKLTISQCRVFQLLFERPLMTEEEGRDKKGLLLPFKYETIPFHSSKSLFWRKI